MNRSIEILILTNSFFNMDEKQKGMVKEMVPSASITTVRRKEASADLIRKAEIIFGWPDEEQLKMRQSHWRKRTAQSVRSILRQVIMRKHFPH